MQIYQKMEKIQNEDYDDYKKKIAGFSYRLGCGSTPSRAITTPLHYRTNAGKPMQRYIKF